MDELAAAASRALEAVGDLSGQTDEAEEVLGDVREGLARGAEELGSHWSRVSGQLVEFAVLAGDRTKELIAEANAGAGSQGQLSAAYETLESEARREREATERELSALTGRMEAMEQQVQEALEEAEQVAAALKDKLTSVDDELDQVLATVQALLEEDLPGELAAFEEEIDARARAVQGALVSEFAPAIDGKIDELLQRLLSAHGRVEEALEAAATSVNEAAEGAVEKWSLCQDALCAELGALTDGAESKLREFAGLAQTGGEGITRERGAIANGAQSTVQAANEALGRIQETEDAIRHYEFVHF